jgi:hypothetical protein
MIAAGVWRLATGDIEPIRYTAGQQGPLHDQGAAGVVTVFLVLRAFASGTTALTGVEAISNGVSAFRAPEAVNAKKTLMVMAAIMGVLFLGITYHALLPRQLRKRGHRLVYSNGIIVLAAGATFLVIAFKASVHALIPLYAIGVVTSFTLAQAGMTRRHLRLREPGWRSGIAINGIGAVVTAVALVVIVVGKFAEGAWMVVIAIPLLVWLLLRIQRTYSREVAQLKVQASQRLAPPKPRHEVMVLIEDLDQAALSALQYARQLNPLTITALHVAVDPDHARELGRLWAKVHIPFPWSWSTPPTATCWPRWRRRWPSGSVPTPRSPSWSHAAATSASGAGSSTTRPRPA